MKFKTKRILSRLAIILAIVTLFGLVANMYGVFDEKKANPDNLVGINTVGEAYADIDEHNNGFGVKYTVDEFGAVKAKGTATANDTFKIATGIRLEAGKTYTLSCGVGSVGYKTYGVRLKNVTVGSGQPGEFIYADLNGTFTCESSDHVYDLEIYVMDEMTVNKTFRPVLIEGNGVGEFFA